MKFLFILYLTFCFIVSSFSQHTFFNEKYFNDFEKRYIENPIECYKKETDQNFIFIYGDGSIGRQENMIQFYTDFAIVNRSITDLKTLQVGSTGIATGVINRVYQWKKDSTLRNWLNRFTYTFSWQKTQWVLVDIHMSDMAHNNAEFEEITLKKILDSETNAFSSADKPTLLKIWKDDPKTIFIGNNADGTFFHLTAKDYKYYIQNSLTPTNFTSINSNFNFNFKGRIVLVDYDQVLSTAAGKKIYQHNARVFEKVGNEWKLILASNHGYNPNNSKKSMGQ
jgi:hypothetical protein